MAGGALAVGSETADHIGQCLRQLDAGLQADYAIHVVQPQLDGNHAVGVAAHIQRAQLIDGVWVGVDGQHAVAHLGIGVEHGGHGGGSRLHRAVGEGDALLPACGDGGRGGRCG